MSSPFRYLDSTAHENRIIADHAASRLSFMLVGAPPAASCAARLRKLRPKVLRAQAQHS